MSADRGPPSRLSLWLSPKQRLASFGVRATQRPLHVRHAEIVLYG